MARLTPEQLLRTLLPPMLATLVSEPPTDDSSWAFELKYDGFRALAALTNGGFAMRSRNDLDLAPRFPSIAAALSRLKIGDVVLDGEIVALDDDGVPRFQLLQGGVSRELIYVFDVLWLNGEDLRRRPYVERRAILEKVLRRAPAGIEVSRQLEESGSEALRLAATAGWEGIIAKRLNSTYEGRRSKEWLKVKAINEQEFAIIGFNLSSATTREIGALHLGVIGDDGAYHYSGKVGTGFSSRLRRDLREILSHDEAELSAAVDAPRVRDAHWVHPRLVAQVSFTEWTDDNRLRHPSFLGLREDKSPEEVVREKVLGEKVSKKHGGQSPTVPQKRAAGRVERAGKIPKKGPPSKPAGKRSVRTATPVAAASRVTLSSPDRVLYPKEGITKAEVAAYYTAMAAPMIAALTDRPLSLEHWNQGVGRPSWFHQNLGKEAPEWLHSVETPTRASSRKTLRHLTVNDLDDLLWLAQMSVLTVHMWASRAEALERPDWIVFDLDPAKGKGIEQAIDAALVMRKLLDHLELPSYPKTSGKRGIHVFVPIAAGYSHEEAARFACDVAAAVTREVPTMTVERSLSNRKGRLYLDCMQNAYGKTIVAPYSLRGIDGAPVSAPLKWAEVNKKLDPLKFNLRTMPARLAKLGDLFAPVLEKGARLPELK